MEMVASVQRLFGVKKCKYGFKYRISRHKAVPNRKAITKQSNTDLFGTSLASGGRKCRGIFLIVQQRSV